MVLRLGGIDAEDNIDYRKQIEQMKKKAIPEFSSSIVITIDQDLIPLINELARKSNMGSEIIPHLISLGTQADIILHRWKVVMNKLSARKREAILLAAKGFNYRKIARIMSLSYHTVRDYCVYGFALLGCKNRTEFFCTYGIIPLIWEEDKGTSME